jgi:hypothetical protein
MCCLPSLNIKVKKEMGSNVKFKSIYFRIIEQNKNFFIKQANLFFAYYMKCYFQSAANPANKPGKKAII